MKFHYNIPPHRAGDFQSNAFLILPRLAHWQEIPYFKEEKEYKPFIGDWCVFKWDSTSKPMDFIALALELLHLTSKDKWAETWVRLRMQFHALYANNTIFSTRFGGEFFQEVARHLHTKKKLVGENGCALGEYDVNFNIWLSQQKSS